ncbi:MAG: UDP-N-acetylmuramoyl-L-alanine--D-glutamate ligase [Flavobacteriales bacterium CG_4_10_14_0_2_um_filter_32_8]|nr:MAG: UDP-N-acetylmuramoyl-L-alanine--D-glutamate ligase [Flavobacteriales bacterium CG_4_10_14_0_2_um_filter_32_8]PJB14412.1 MAG: UDP-N-acetylmuramoyl-L-alanine--D-glutamate ligase [Flavobacteriales bacterium CG_4_9_14_3_um_filter_32_8]
MLAKKKGFEVFVSDKGKIKEKYKNVLINIDVEWEEEKHTVAKILNATEVVKSPGIPDTAPLILQLKEKGIAVISEIEFAGRYTQAKIIGITGSNGKTTTTLLTYHLLKKAGLNVGLAGNIGDSLAKQVAEDDKQIYVLELSSFQLDGMFDFHIDIAMILNITPDHLDRYDYQFENYVESKFRILQNQTDSDHVIYCYDDEEIMKRIDNYKGIKHPFSIKTVTSNGAYSNKENLIINTNNKLYTMTIQELALQGKHNLYNSMAAGIAGKVLELKKDIIRESLTDFQNIEHRLEEVGKVHGITFVNDSKATNVNSTWYALESFQHPLIWIVGGVDKGNDYQILEQLVADKVKAIVCLGKDNTKIHEAFKGIIENIVDAESAQEAVKLAYQFGVQGDTVLLSPACASFDLFDNYEDRGQQFKKAVRAL